MENFDCYCCLSKKKKKGERETKNTCKKRLYKRKKSLLFQYRLFMKNCKIVNFEAPLSKNRIRSPPPFFFLPPFFLSFPCIPASVMVGNFTSTNKFRGIPMSKVFCRVCSSKSCSFSKLSRNRPKLVPRFFLIRV